MNATQINAAALRNAPQSTPFRVDAEYFSDGFRRRHTLALIAYPDVDELTGEVDGFQVYDETGEPLCWSATLADIASDGAIAFCHPYESNESRAARGLQRIP